jgi:hypothetical protein
MAHPLNDPCNLIKRANRNLVEINDVLTEWRSQNPYTLVREPDGDEPVYRFKLVVNDHPPDDLGTAIGEFAYNLRAGLNQLVWQLSLRFTPDLDPSALEGTTEFPIFHEFKSDDIRKRLRLIKDSDARAIIRGLQPYHQGDSAKQDLLSVIYYLHNVSKYQVLQALGLLIRYRVGFGSSGQGIGLNLTIRHFDDETPILVPRLQVPGFDLQVDFTFGVALADVGPTGFVTTETFRAMYDYVSGILLSFERFFSD